MIDMGYVEVGEHEKEFSGTWRIFNGVEWVHAFTTKKEAIKRAKSWGGTAVGKARFNPETEMNEYLEVEAVKPLVEA